MTANQQQNIAVISLNIAGFPFPRHTHARFKAFCKSVAESDATILNLQEVHTYPLLWLLRKHLPQFQYANYKFGIFGPRAGLVTLSRIPIRHTEFFSLTAVTQGLPLSQRPPKAMLESRHKGVLITNLGAITAMNVHLNPNMDGNWSKENRFYPLHKLQLEALNDLVNQSQFENSIIIMSGDFNLAKDCDLFPEFLKQGYWDDAFAGDLTPTFRAEFLKAGRIAHCIDYVLVRDPKHKVQVKELSYRFAGKVELANGTTAFISDHKGLYAKLSL